MNGGTSVFLFPQQVKFSLEKGFEKRGGGEGGVRMYAFTLPVYGNETWNDFRILKDLTV